MPVEPTGPVVVDVDASEASLSVVDLAAEEAAARAAPLLIVHGYGTGSLHLAAHHDLLDVAVSRALAARPGLSVTAKLIAREPGRALAEHSADACLLVVGHRTAAARRVPSAISVAAQVMLESLCPVIAHVPAVTPRPADKSGPVLLGVTRHSRTEQVVEFAFEEAALRGAPLRAVHVWPDRDDAVRLLDQALGAWPAKYPEVRVTRRVCPGYDVARALCDESRDAQLLVIGRGRYTGRARVMRGLAIQTMLDLSGCPVAVVPHA
ncbi:MAG: universal stress protein [Micromonosporaceae bacterium]|nr:universal stress protein [Micromonosporaceae bacterium]